MTELFLIITMTFTLFSIPLVILAVLLDAVGLWSKVWRSK